MLKLKNFSPSDCTSDGQMLNRAIALAKSNGELTIPPVNPRTGEADIAVCV